MIVAVLFAVSHICEDGARDASPGPEELLPSEFCGWRASGPDGLFTGDTLHEYIDGASEIYRALNVKKVVARRYEKEGAPTITVDIFEMAGPADAFGAYHHDIRDGESASIGCESEYEGASLAFWKGRNAVYVSAGEAPEPVRSAILDVGRAIAAAIDVESGPPEILSQLPENGMPGQVRYFHNHSLLNLYYYVSDENLLRLGPDTEGVLGWYKVAENPPMTCAVIRYLSESAARDAHGAFMSGYLPDADAEGIAETENARWAGARLDGRLLRLVFDAPARGAAAGALSGLSDGL